MKHNIRINGQVKEIDCELGSGVFDKNGKEIFEGDRVSYKGKVGGVYFRNGDFILDDACALHCLISGVDLDGHLEVVGHANERQFKDTEHSWSPQLRDAYNRLLDTFIARKSPETVCEAALAVVKAAKSDNRFEETTS